MTSFNSTTPLPVRRFGGDFDFCDERPGYGRRMIVPQTWTEAQVAAAQVIWAERFATGAYVSVGAAR